MKRSNDSQVTVVNLGIRWKISNCPSDFKVLGSSAFFLLTLFGWTSTALWLTCSCRPGGCFVETLRSFGSFCVGACFVFYTWDRDLTFTSARVLVRAHVDGPGSQPTDAEDHTSCFPVLSCPLWWCYHRMCGVAKRPGCLLVRTCSRTWVFLRRLHI